jgi:putative hemolysin
MSEIALVSARKSRLQFLVKKGDKKAMRALDLSNRPERFLSAIQIGITLVGIFLGVYSGENIADDLGRFISRIDILEPYSRGLALFLVVLLVTFLSVVLGELVPKQIGLGMPEKVARVVAWPIQFFSVITRPFVWLLSQSSRLVIRMISMKPSTDDRITEEEIKSLIDEGTRHGEVQDVEADIVDRVFILGDTNIKSLMTYKSDITWIDISDTKETIREKVLRTLHTNYPVADKNLDEIAGTVSLKELFISLEKPDFDLGRCIREPYYLHENTSAYEAIKQFRSRKVFHALVIDEYGSVEGIITVNDILESLVGEVSPEEEEYRIVQRNESSWLVDGQYPFHEFLNHFDMQELYEENHYNTLSGLILEKLGYIPRAGDKINWMDFEIEVVDMDRARIDKVMVSKV